MEKEKKDNCGENKREVTRRNIVPRNGPEGESDLAKKTEGDREMEKEALRLIWLGESEERSRSEKMKRTPPKDSPDGEGRPTNSTETPTDKTDLVAVKEVNKEKDELDLQRDSGSNDQTQGLESDEVKEEAGEKDRERPWGKGCRGEGTPDRTRTRK